MAKLNNIYNMNTLEQEAEIEYKKEDQEVIARYQDNITAMREEPRGMMMQAMHEVFWRQIADSEWEALFSFPARSITHDYALSTNKVALAFFKVYTPALECVSVLYQDNEPIGAVHLTFIKRKDELRLEIRHRYLMTEHQGQGIGMDIEWGLQNFCRKHGISAMYNQAQTSESGNGAYTWALYGYEFADSQQDCESLSRQLQQYATRHEIKLKYDPRYFDRPIYFARAIGINTNGETTPIGKRLLTDAHQGCTWRGRRDVALDSDGVKDFVEYAKKRGRNDIAEEYAHFLSTLAHNAKAP